MNSIAIGPDLVIDPASFDEGLNWITSELGDHGTTVTCDGCTPSKTPPPPPPPPVTGPTTSTITTITTTDPIVIDTTTGRGGALSNLIGNSRVGQAVWDLIDSGVSPQDISVDESFRLSNGRLVRPDIAVYKSGALDQLIEVKGGYASGTRVMNQAANYARLGEEEGVPVLYRLFNNGSGSFLNRLELLHIPTY